MSKNAVRLHLRSPFTNLYDEAGLTPDFRRSLNFIFLGNLCGTICGIICTSGSTAMVGLASSLGAGDLAFGIMAALMQASALMQIPFSMLVNKTHKRKKYLLTYGLICRALWLVFGLIPVFIPANPSWLRLYSLIFLLGASSFLGAAINVCWFPWFSDLAPISIRGRWLSIRDTVISVISVGMGLVIAWLLDTSREETSPTGNVGIGETANVTLDVNDEIGEVIKVVRQLGYELSDEDNAKVYEAFRRVATRKHFVGTKELDAIVASTALQVPSTYHIENYVINSGNVITATANILLDRNGEKLRGVGVGDGPIDAAFLAIEQIIGHHYELDDFQIQTVTEGRDAMGSALVKLRADGRVYSGNGISTDIIGASIRAYISALNKIVYEEA